MLKFKKLTLSDVDTIKEFMSYSTNRACDNTVCGRVMWRDYLNTEYAIHEDALYFKVNISKDCVAFSMPLAKDLSKALITLKEYCHNNSLPLIFSPIMKEDLPYFAELFKFDIEADRDWFDYLYNAQDLATLIGKRYNGQRNHINFFKKTHPEYRFKPINSSNIDEVKNYYKELSAIYNKDTAVYKEEQKKVIEVLENYGKLNLLGGVLYIDNKKIVGFSIGEVVGDTLFVHIEKAMLSVRGASQMLVKEFANTYTNDNIIFINREEDVGDIGLRTSKLSYHPIELIEKYTLKVK